MKNLYLFKRRAILFIMFGCLMQLATAQDCYQVYSSTSGIDGLYDEAKLDSVACALVSAVGAADFKIVGEDRYPIMSYVTPIEGFEKLHTRAKATLDSAYTSYLLIAKDIYKSEIFYRVHVKFDGQSVMESWSNTDRIIVLDELNRIANEGDNSFLDNTEVELKVMARVISFINDGIILDLFNSDAFDEIPLSENDIIEKNELAESLTIANVTVHNLDGYHLEGENLVDLFTQIQQDTITQARSYGIYITDQGLTSDSLQFQNIHEQYVLDQSKYKIWLHFGFVVPNMASLTSGSRNQNQSGDRILHIKTDNNLTTKEAEKDLNDLFYATYKNWTNVDPQSVSPFIQNCLQPDVQWGKNCIYHNLKDVSWLSDQPLATLNAAFISGFIDGFIGTVSFVLGTWDLVKGLANEVESRSLGGVAFSLFFGASSNVLIFGKNVYNRIAQHESIVKYLTWEYNNVKEFLSDMADKMKTAYNWIHSCFLYLSNISQADIILFCANVYDELKQFIQSSEFIETLESAVYFVGTIAFEIILDVVLTYVTAGSYAVLKTSVVGAKIAKGFTTMFKNVENMSKFLGEIIERFRKGVGDLSPSALKCKILGKGCFVKDTPVLMANKNYRSNIGVAARNMAVAAAMPIIAVPIQDVQLLDYTVTHETVNAWYGLTASTEDDIYLGLLNKDPYTSDQQRERDEYELDDENWYEVIFEEVHGGSTAKLALHQNWINQKGYEVDAVVEINMPEQGISGPFRITSIKHILPQKIPVDDDETDEYGYRPVTALFTHHSNQVFIIDFDNGESIGVTYQHPIYSMKAGDWKFAGELDVGEEVLNYEGKARVASLTKKEGSETVYNLEVQEVHNFLVGESGIVVHNSCAKSILGKIEYDRLYRELRDEGFSPSDARELIEDSVSAAMKDEVLKSGVHLSRGLVETIRIEAREFAADVLLELGLQIVSSGFSLSSPLSSADEVTFDIETADGIFTTIPDQVVMDQAGNLHFGEAKYSRKEKNWETDYTRASTANQLDFYDALEDGEILNVTPRGPANKLGRIGLSPGQSFSPTKIKSIHLMGSNKAQRTIKTILRLF